MTSTGTYQGMDLDKPSSKVMAPPGGASNFVIGGYSEDPTPARTNNTNSAKPPSQDVVTPSVPQPAPTQRNNQKQAPKRYNPITGEEIVEDEEIKRDPTTGTDASTAPCQPSQPAPAPAQVASVPAAGYHSSTRVRQPPGGASTPLW